MTADSGTSHPGTELRRDDPDRYLTAMLAPPPYREHLFALYAFNVEIAKVREVVSEPMLGEIRLQWWRDVIEEIYGGTVRRHAVAQALNDVVAAKRLSRRYFDALIDARAFDLTDEPPATMAALVDYAAGTSANLVALALEAMDARGDDIATVGRDVGIGWALTGLIRAIPAHAQARRLYVPRELTERHGVDVGELLELRSSVALCAAVRDVADQAAAHLRAARRARNVVPKGAVPALLVGRLADLYLRRLRSVGFDPFDVRLLHPMPFKGLRLAYAAIIGRF
ncbi:MAG: squalene/phytoene synthase family protein [Alphaproteobacteria bacterium]|nr:squalene/phytoene synthase family protein [Alphaproteobacteria bacterium]